MAEATYKAGDTWPPLLRQLTETIDGAEDPIDLTGATVGLRIKSGSTLVTQTAQAPADPDDGTLATGWVEVVWDADDLAVPGTYRGVFRVTTAAGKRFTVPNSGAFELVVEEDVA